MCGEIKLEPCPFCGSDDVVFGAGLEDEYYVECWDCGAKIESYNGMEDAVAGWNARAIDRDDLLKVAEELEAGYGCRLDEYHSVAQFAENAHEYERGIAYLIRKAVGE